MSKTKKEGAPSAKETGYLDQWLGISGAENVLKEAQKEMAENKLNFEDPAKAKEETRIITVYPIEEEINGVKKELADLKTIVISNTKTLDQLQQGIDSIRVRLTEIRTTPGNAGNTAPAPGIPAGKYAEAIQVLKDYFSFIKQTHPDWGDAYAQSYQDTKKTGTSLLKTLKSYANIDIANQEEFLSVLKNETWLKFYPQTESFWPAS